MAKFTLWKIVSELLTVHALITILFPLGFFAGLAVYLASFTAFVEMFAPLSYLAVGLVAAILSLMMLNGLASLARNLGWKPAARPPRRKAPVRDAPLTDVIRYMARESQWGIDTIPTVTNDAEVSALVQDELNDRIGECDLNVWARSGRFGVRPVMWGRAFVDVKKQVVVVVGDLSTSEVDDVQMNWKQVRKTWPKISRWRRALKVWQSS